MYAREVSDELMLDVVPVQSAHEAVSEADIVVTITSSRTPILYGEWLEPGMSWQPWAARTHT